MPQQGDCGWHVRAMLPGAWLPRFISTADVQQHVMAAHACGSGAAWAIMLNKSMTANARQILCFECPAAMLIHFIL